MWFLFLQIFLFLLLAALFGAVLAYWWLRRQYEDVTVDYNSLLSKDAEVNADALTRSDFQRALRDFAPPAADLSPLEERLQTLETAIGNIQFPETDLSPVQSRLTDIEGSLSTLENTDTSRLENQLDVLATAFAERKDADLDPVEKRLSSLEETINSFSMPEVDLGPIHSGLTRVEMSLANMDTPEFDVSTLESRIHALHENVAEHRTLDVNEKDDLHKRITAINTSLGTLSENMANGFTAGDLAPVLKRLDDVETRIAHINVPEPDLKPIDEGLGIIHGRLSTMENRLDELPRQQVDLGFLQQRLEQVQTDISRLERMEAQLASLRADIQGTQPNLDPLEQRIIRLQNDVANQPEPDLSPVLHSVYAMEQRMDFAAMEHRLTSIEYRRLAAMHHMLRSRQANGAGYPKTPPPAGNSRAAPPPPPATDQYRPPRPVAPQTPPPPSSPWSDEVPMPNPFDVPDMPEHSGFDYVPAPMPEPREPAYHQPEPARDAVAEARRPDDKANLLTRPAFGTADDLEEISGVGPMLHGLLTEIGVFYFWQVAEWGPDEVEWVDGMLDGFNGRIQRDDWVGQAKILATGEHAAKRP